MQAEYGKKKEKLYYLTNSNMEHIKTIIIKRIDKYNLTEEQKQILKNRLKSLWMLWKAKQEDIEDKKNKFLDRKIEEYRNQPAKWYAIEKRAMEELTEEQRQSPIRDALVKIRIRMIISNL